MKEKIIYQFNGETYETREEAEKAVYYYAEDTYDEVLDMGDDIIICGLSYSPSIALKRVDEIAYRCGLHDYMVNHYFDPKVLEEYQFYYTAVKKDLENENVPVKDRIAFASQYDRTLLPSITEAIFLSRQNRERRISAQKELLKEEETFE